MWLRLLPNSVSGNLLPGRWRLALVRQEELLRRVTGALELGQLLGPSRDYPASYAPADEVRCFVSESFGAIRETAAVRVESVHRAGGIVVQWHFEADGKHILVEQSFRPASNEDLK